MGRKSIKENKNVYQQAREELNLTRENAEDLLEFVSADRIEKIESGKSFARPEEVLRMSECYKRPELCNYYCSHECAIGKKYVPEIETKDLSQITLEMLAVLNQLNQKRDRLIEITVDGEISDEEIEDFESIRRQLDDMSMTIDALSLWVENAINSGQYK